MAEQTKEQTAGITTAEVEKLLKKQADDFAQKMAEQKQEMQDKIDTMAEENKKLTDELANIKTNTAEENALLGEQIKAITKNEELPQYNPFADTILYRVKNEVAGIETIMTGDEVEGIIGSIDKHLIKKLVNGEKEIQKHPYTIILIEKAEAKPKR